MRSINSKIYFNKKLIVIIYVVKESVEYDGIAIDLAIAAFELQEDKLLIYVIFLGKRSNAKFAKVPNLYFFRYIIIIYLLLLVVLQICKVKSKVYVAVHNFEFTVPIKLFA
jgi:hypothetical protein